MEISQLKPGLQDFKPGDWMILLSGITFTCWLTLSFWFAGAPDKVIIRSSGKIFRELPLTKDIVLQVPGPLGISTISIHNRQARITADPSPRQYCVKQGWLKQAGEIAICLPNQISLELVGNRKRYDSLTY